MKVTNEIQIGDKVKIKDNLSDELIKLGFDKGCVVRMQDIVGKEYEEVFNIWTDSVSQQKYATVDLCIEIPLQCLENLSK